MLHDLKYALRGIMRRPGHTALIVLTLAVGLGVNTVAFSSVNALLFRPFHIVNASQYGWLFLGAAGNPFGSSTRDMFDALRRDSTTTERVVAEGRMPLSVGASDGPEQVWGLAVSSDYFQVVQAPMVEGRALSQSDLANETIPILISERYWRTRWNGAPLATVRPVLNGQATAVIGVVGDTFQGPGGIFEPHLWFPLDAARSLTLAVTPTDTWLTLMAQPKPGATPAHVAADAKRIAIGVDAAAPAPDTTRSERNAQYVPIADGHPEAQSLAAPAAMAMAAVGLVLLIACFNVAGLVLARSAERQRELGLRTALGASRFRITRQLLTEGLVLATLAGAGALLLAQWSEALLGGLSLPAPIPQRLHFTMDFRMVAFTAALVVIAATVPVLAPAWQVFRVDPIRWLKFASAGSGGGATPARARRAFVVLQGIGSTAFLTLALMFVTSYVSASRTDPGFNTTHIALMEITPGRFAITPERQRTLVRDLLARLERAADVGSVAVAERLPFHIGTPDVRRLAVDNRDCATSVCVPAITSAVTTSFFDTMSIPLRAGRLFDWTSGADAQTVVINEATAAQLWPGRSPLGEWLHDEGARPPRQVIGVVSDIVSARFDRPHEPAVYRPLSSDQFSGALAVVVRSRRDADAAATLLRATWRDLDSSLPPVAVQTMEARMELPLWPARVGAAFFATCGTLAVLLVTIGLFGVTYFAVIQRTREFGIRLALGATGADLRRLVMGESVRLMLPGLLIGLMVAAGASSLARVALIGVSPLDPRWYVAAVILQAGVALLASWSPARRAARVSPQITLRGE